MKFKVGDIIIDKGKNPLIVKIIGIDNNDYEIKVLKTGIRQYGNKEYVIGTEAFFYTKVTDKYCEKTIFFNYNKYWAELNE